MMTACSHASNGDGVRFAGYIGEDDYHPSKSVMELLSEHARVSPGGHAYLYLKKGDGSEKPTKQSIADIYLRVLDVSDGVISEDTTTVTVNAASPLIEDMVTQMVVGDKVRVWGDSYLRIWEIELLDFRPIPEDTSNHIAQGWPRYPEKGEAKQRITKHVDREKIQKDQFIHIIKTHYKSLPDGDLRYIYSYDLIVQVSPYTLSETEYDLFTNMSVGEQVRTWYLQKPGIPDIVSDVWILDRYPQYETPEMLKPPEDKSAHIGFGLYKKMIVHDDNAPKIGEQEKFEISMNCWNTDNGRLVTTTDLDYDGRHVENRDRKLHRQKLYRWRDIVEFEHPRESAYSWCEYVDPDSFKGRECARSIETENRFDEMEQRVAGNSGYKYRLSFVWQALLKDVAKGDVFMAWISGAALRESPRARDAMHPDHYLNLTCRVAVDSPFGRPVTEPNP